MLNVSTKFVTSNYSVNVGGNSNNYGTRNANGTNLHEENAVVHLAVRVCASDVIKMSTYRGRTRRAVCSISSLYIPAAYAWAFTVCFLKSTENSRRRAPTSAGAPRQRVEKKIDYVEFSSLSSDLLSLVSTHHGAWLITCKYLNTGNQLQNCVIFQLQFVTRSWKKCDSLLSL